MQITLKSGLVALVLALSSGLLLANEAAEYRPEDVRFFTPTDDMFEVAPGSGLYLRHWHGPNLTYISLKVDAGKGWSIPASISRHDEDSGYVVKGSMYYKSGYNGEFEKVLRAGDSFIVPACIPHAAIFGWDDNEETILVASTAGKAVEYGKEGQLPPGLSSKASAGEINDMVVTPACRALKNAPPVTWTVEDMARPGPE
ncbi:MAG: hypothetical protein J4A00_02530 [Gammaproteobacteria bacterium]|nr:hypothetical protein [Gammaproteobacteria bacterium]